MYFHSGLPHSVLHSSGSYLGHNEKLDHIPSSITKVIRMHVLVLSYLLIRDW